MRPPIPPYPSRNANDIDTEGVAGDMRERDFSSAAKRARVASRH